MRAEIISIGTELLLGEIVDTNTAEVARALRRIGADLHRTTIVGDNLERIARAVQESLDRSDVVLTTGGLGPTVDDPTREAIARALDVPLEFQAVLWEQIQERFARFRRRPTPNNRRQAYLPKGSRALENPVGTAPGFLAEWHGKVVISLPGVPSEMRNLLDGQVLPFLVTRFSLTSMIVVRILRTAGLGESWLDERIQDLERLENPSVGVSAHPGRVDIRITAKAEGPDEARRMIDPIEQELHKRLGAAVYGADSETLESAVAQLLKKQGWRLTVVEIGTAGSVAAAFVAAGETFAGGLVLPAEAGTAELEQTLREKCSEFSAQVGLGLRLARENDRHAIQITVMTPEISQSVEQTYGGPPESAQEWAVNMALDRLRRKLATSG